MMMNVFVFRSLSGQQERRPRAEAGGRGGRHTIRRVGRGPGVRDQRQGEHQRGGGEARPRASPSSTMSGQWRM